MRATLRLASEVTADAGTQAVIAVEDTKNILTDLITPIYIFGLLGPLVFGWIGECLVRWVPATAIARLGFDPGFDHLGHIPAEIAFLAVNCYAWVVVARIESLDLLIHVMPEWVAKRVAKWSTHSDPTKQYSKMLWFVAMFGLWGPVLMWVPIEFPVWRYPYQYLGALCSALSTTFFVGTIKDWNITRWRTLLGTSVAVFFIRHLLGVLGFSIPTILGFVSTTHVNNSRSLFVLVLLLAAGFATASLLFGSKQSNANKPH